LFIVTAVLTDITLEAIMMSLFIRRPQWHQAVATPAYHHGVVKLPSSRTKSTDLWTRWFCCSACWSLWCVTMVVPLSRRGTDSLWQCEDGRHAEDVRARVAAIDAFLDRFDIKSPYDKQTQVIV